jgi:hypothetical protein
MFKTYQFENNPNGKMLLVILFATSKQYSDKLAVDVARGITGNIKDGKYTGQSNRGYYADKSTGYFTPDGFNWELMGEAVKPSLELLDNVLSKFFSNLVLKSALMPPKNAITRWEVTDFKLREPYAGFFKDSNFELGRG